jgi:DsbC/DsbD-like thiol-disulfide interchange protein
MIALLLFCTVVAGAPIAAPRQEPQVPPDRPALESKRAPDGNRLVKLALAADHAAIRPGEKLTLAAQFAIEPKWHIYWENPGDAGVPTKIDVHAPPGFTVAGVSYPVPEREESAGDLVSYVYKGEVALLVDLKAPEDLKSGETVEIGIDGRWLVCTSVCLVGGGKASLSLATAARSEPARLAHEQEFKSWREKLPRPYEDLVAIAGYHDSRFTDWKQPFAVSVPGALALDFYPRVQEPISLEIRNLELKREADACTLKLTFEPPAGYGGNHFEFGGVLAVRAAGGEKYYDLGFGYTTLR